MEEDQGRLPAIFQGHVGRYNIEPDRLVALPGELVRSHEIVLKQRYVAQGQLIAKDPPESMRFQDHTLQAPAASETGVRVVLCLGKLYIDRFLETRQELGETQYLRVVLSQRLFRLTPRLPIGQFVHETIPFVRQ